MQIKDKYKYVVFTTPFEYYDLNVISFTLKNVVKKMV